MRFDTRDKKPKLWSIAVLSGLFLALLAVFFRLGAEEYGAAISVGAHCGRKACCRGKTNCGRKTH